MTESMLKKALTAGLALALVVALIPTAALAESESDGGYFDFFSDGGKIGNRFVTWFWQPHYFPGGIDYDLFLLCQRVDSEGFLTGNNKVTVKNIAFVGLDSGLQIDVKKQSRKLSKFHNNGYLVVNLPLLELLANDSFVIAEVQFQIKGSSDVDQIKCSADVTESESIASAGAAQVKPAPARSAAQAAMDSPGVLRVIEQ